MLSDCENACHEKMASLRRQGLEELFPSTPRITVSMGTCGKAAGARSILEAVRAEAADSGLTIESVGCNGMCWAEPLMTVHLPGKGRALYGPVNERKARRIARQALEGDHAPNYIAISVQEEFPLLNEKTGIKADSHRTLDNQPYMEIQERNILCKSGHICPTSVPQYCAYGGYFALEKTVNGKLHKNIVEVVENSGLRGRGGAGFPTGLKWRVAAEASDAEKFVIANADEGDPGAFMDRMIMESDPHAILEGMAIAAYAIGAKKGYIFTRSEYPLAFETMTEAIREAERHGLLGADILGSGFDFDVKVIRSAGAYVCGEETAMIRALEGFPGKPTKRPPYAAEKGLWGKPTIIDNIETLANIPLVIGRGSEWFKSFGTPESSGTKLFSIAGDISCTGVVEVPLGLRSDELVKGIGLEIDSIKAFQFGGPSGIFIPGDTEFTLDYESLSSFGGSIGSGGIVFLGNNDCIIDTVKYLIEFSERESCGQCNACKHGLRRCSQLLAEFTNGTADTSVIQELRTQAKTLEDRSFCGLGKMAARPLISSLQFFQDEYEAHMEGRCPGKACKELIGFSVIAEKCPGCFCCKPTCPTNAMRGSFGKPFQIDERLCIRCWMCVATCPYDAVEIHEQWDR